MSTHAPTVLVILDGWGHRSASANNAIANARTPMWDQLRNSCAYRLMSASGTDVGLPEQQMGNSEVGHMNLGAGRVIYQPLTRIDKAIEDGSFADNDVFLHAFAMVKQQQSQLHIMGLLSDGGIHSHQQHIESLITVAAQQGIDNLVVHAFLDGRDTPPRSAKSYLSRLTKQLDQLGCGRIGSLMGRYYAMDRDQRWSRTERAYQALTQGIGSCYPDALTALEQAYSRGEDDEFVQPCLIADTDQNKIAFADNDVVVFMNFRADRARQLTAALTQAEFTGFRRNTIPNLSRFVSLTEYASNLATSVAFPPIVIENSLGETIAKHGLRQLRLAETEKYAHVTFFFNGGLEQPFPGEDRLLIPSPQVDTYDLQPEMSAVEVTDALVNAIENRSHDVIICNFANPDMVGHTGNFQATVTAIETIDHCLTRIVSALNQQQGQALITADHGNAEKMFDPNTNQPHTAHTNLPIPLLYVGPQNCQFDQQPAILADIAPTLLSLMGLTVPAEMTGRCLLNKP